MVFTEGVSSRIETTLACCQADALGTLVTVVPLFAPRITVAVVAVHLPEPGLVVLHEAEAPYPFGGLPEVELRYQQAGRSAVCRGERFAVVFPDHERLAFEQVLDRHVGRIATIAKRHHKGRRGFLEPSCCEDPIDGDSAPVRVELRPASHAVNIHGDLC